MTMENTLTPEPPAIPPLPPATGSASRSEYNIIYADPPWPFGNRMYSSNKNDHHVEMSRHYPVMNCKDIAALPVKNIVAEDAICLMWSTDAHLKQAIETMEAWGFKYKTVAFIWLKKEASGKPVCFMGCWTMKQAEIVILGTRGTMTKHLKSRKVRQLVEAPRDRKRHSGKPAAVREKITEMFGDMPRLEMFARIKTPGWDVWGNELANDVELVTQNAKVS